MDEPITWRIVQAVATMLADIKKANGYSTDLGLLSVLSDRSQVTDDLASYLAVIAGDISPIEEKVGNRSFPSTMDLTIEYALAMDNSGTVNPELLAHRGRADIVQALHFDFRGLVPGFTNLTITGTRITSAPLAGSNFVLAQVSARAGLSESKPPAN